MISGDIGSQWSLSSNVTHPIERDVGISIVVFLFITHRKKAHFPINPGRIIFPIYPNGYVLKKFTIADISSIAIKISLDELS